MNFKRCYSMSVSCFTRLLYFNSATRPSTDQKPKLGGRFIVYRKYRQMTGRGHCAVFLGKILHSHGAFHHPRVLMDTEERNDGGWVVNMRWTSIPYSISGKSSNTPGRFMLQKTWYAKAWWATWLLCRLHLCLPIKLASKTALTYIERLLVNVFSVICILFIFAPFSFRV